MNFPPGNLVGLLGQSHDGQFVGHVVRGVLAALASYHDAGQPFGQVRADTVYLAADGRVRLGDVRATIVSTQVEAPEGLSKYLPPETLAAETFGEVGPATDLYALGMLAIELLVGPPFASLFEGVAEDPLGGDLAWMRWHGDAARRLPPVRQIVPGVDAALAAAIDRMTHKRVADRPANARQVLAMLETPSAGAAEQAVGAGDQTAEEAARRTTDAGTAATIYFEDTVPPEQPASEGLAPLEGWREDIRSTPRSSTLADVPTPVAEPSPPAREAIAAVPPEPSRPYEPPAETAPPAAYGVRGTMMPDEDLGAVERRAEAAEPATLAAEVAQRPPREPELPPAMRLVKRRGPFDHPATLIAISVAIIAVVAYLLFFAWPVDDGARTVRIISAPAGAKISIDGVPSGEKTPSELKLAIGKHDIAVALDGHYEAKRSIEIVKDDRQREIVLELKKLPTARLVRIVTEPADAAVYLDGDSVPLAARTPTEEMLSLKRHTVVVKKSGYQDATVEIDVVLGEGPLVERITLAPLPKRIENVVLAVDPPDATLTSGGKAIAVSQGKASVAVEEGSTLDLAAKAEGYADWSQSLGFDDLEKAQFAVNVSLDPYLLFVPPDAAVKVNGSPLPLDGGRAVLPASANRSYRIEAAAKGYKPLDVTLSRSELVQRKFRFELSPGPRPPSTLREVGDGRFVHDALDKAGAPLYFVVIAPGDFVYGAASDGIRNGELPQRTARIDKPYLISTTEVSVRQYAIFAAAAGAAKAGAAWRLGDLDAAAKLPVTNVSHEQAKNFAAYVGGALPSELEWERAARGTNGRIYPWPDEDEPSKDRCNLGFEGNESLMPVDALKDGITPEGVLNMLGNAAEWCEDLYEPGHRDIDDQTPGIRRFRTIRGGSYLEPFDRTMRNARSTMRANADPARGGRDIGIRVVIPFEGT